MTVVTVVTVVTEVTEVTVKDEEEKYGANFNMGQNSKTQIVTKLKF